MSEKELYLNFLTKFWRSRAKMCGGYRGEAYGVVSHHHKISMRTLTTIFYKVPGSCALRHEGLYVFLYSDQLEQLVRWFYIILVHEIYARTLTSLFYKVPGSCALRHEWFYVLLYTHRRSKSSMGFFSLWRVAFFSITSVCLLVFAVSHL